VVGPDLGGEDEDPKVRIRYFIRRTYGSGAWHELGPRPPAGMMSLCGQYFKDGSTHQLVRLEPGEDIPKASGHTCQSCARIAEGAT